MRYDGVLDKHKLRFFIFVSFIIFIIFLIFMNYNYRLEKSNDCSDGNRDLSNLFFYHVLAHQKIHYKQKRTIQSLLSEKLTFILKKKRNR